MGAYGNKPINGKDGKLSPHNKVQALLIQEDLRMALIPVVTCLMACRWV